MNHANNQKLKIGTGLNPLAPDTRDFALGAIFTHTSIDSVPSTDFVVCEPYMIKNQGDTDFCVAYAGTAVSEDQEGVELNPEYQIMKTKEIQGDIDSWGADLRSGCKSFVKVGSLEQSIAREYMDKFGMQGRSSILNPKNWSKPLDVFAAEHKKETYFKVTGKYDEFDNIRAWLWTFRNERRTILTGANFRNDWISAPHGIIPKAYGDDGFGHAFKIYGQKLIDGELYLMAQLSNGTMIGDGGIFYFPREVVNKEVSQFGAFVFKDMPKEVAKQYIDAGVKEKDPAFIKTIKIIIRKIYDWIRA